MRIILHIGLHKTGTSSIQRACWRNKHRLFDAGLYWPDADSFSDTLTQHSFVPWTFRKERNTALITEFFDKVIHFAQKSNCHTILVSGEEFSRLNDEEMEVFYSALPAAEYDIYILFRNIKHYILSMFTKELELGRITFSLETFLERISMLQPDELLNRWEYRFGQESVHVALYENFIPLLIKRFFGWIGFPEISIPECHENKSLDVVTAFLVSALVNHNNDNVLIKSRHIFDSIFPIPHRTEVDDVIANVLMAKYVPKVNHLKLAPFREAMLDEKMQNINYDADQYVRKLTMYLSELLRQLDEPDVTMRNNEKI